jgi:hypothetical protein
MGTVPVRGNVICSKTDSRSFLRTNICTYAGAGTLIPPYTGTTGYLIIEKKNIFSKVLEGTGNGTGNKHKVMACNRDNRKPT